MIHSTSYRRRRLGG